MTILDRIAVYKREEIAAAKAKIPLAEMLARARAADPVRGFRAALRCAREEGRIGLIGEIKKASPSRGLIRVDFDPPSLARAYAQGGAACLSVLTDAPSFQGAPEFLKLARTAAPLPALRKDFMLDVYQVAEARAWDADAILVILAMVDDAVAAALMDTAKDFALDVLVEVHDKRELDRALALDAEMIGINNRDLHTFETRLETTLTLAPLVPRDKIVVAESGFLQRADLDNARDAGVATFLVGEGLMREADVAAATRRLLGERNVP
jgi:indole-3-glycerol phosphate synthase